MMRILLMIIMSCACALVQAQSHTRINNYWDNPYYVNPASINYDFTSVFTLSGRSQWIKFPGSPKSAFASGTMMFDNLHVQLGLKAYQDQIGYTKTTFVSGSYTYALPVNQTWRLNMGIAPSFQSLGYDLSLVNSENTSDNTVFEETTRENTLNTDLGVEFTNQVFRFGISSLNIFSLFFNKDKHQVNTNFAYAIYRTYGNVAINYGGGISLIQYRSIFQPEVMVNTYFKSRREEDLFQLGIFYRPTSEMGAILGFNISPSLQISYSYDFNVGGISRSSIGTHELMIVYRINRCPTCY